MRKLKILHFANQLSLGGTERAALTWCKYLDKDKFDVFFAIRNPENHREKFCSEIGLPVFHRSDFTSLIEELGIDIIHLHRSGSAETMSFQVKDNSPVIMETNVFNLSDDSGFSKHIKAHLFMSRTSMERYFTRTAKHSEIYYDYLYNPVEPLFFENLPLQKNITNVIGRVSREDLFKWGKESILIARFLKDKMPDFKYRIIGAVPVIEQSFKLLGVSENTEYLEQRDNDYELTKFYDSLNVFVHSAQIGETFGSVIAEAMARKLPVVTLRFGGRSADNAQEELVEHYKTGFVADNFQEFCNYTLKLLKEPALAEEMGRLGHKKALEQFEANRLTRKLEGIYLSLAEKYL